MTDVGIDWHAFDDGPDPDDVSREDLGDFTIRWVDDRGFEPVTIRADLVRRGKNLEVPMELDGPPVLDPPDVIALELDAARSSETVAVFVARLTDEVLRDPRFGERVASPVQATFRVKPLAEMAQTLALVTAGPAVFERSCRIGVERPPSRIRWENPEQGGVRDQRFDVAADSRDTMELHVWYERWNPATNRMEADPDVEFSHMTNERFDPQVFGPHPDSQPWVTAGSGDTRWCSRWKSNMVLPAQGRRETLPWDGAIRVKAWRRGDILDRPAPNRIRLRSGAKPLAIALVPVRLGLGRAKARLVAPEAPVCADGESHEIVIQFVDEATALPLEQGPVSWELATGTRYPGGTLDPTTAVLSAADEGKVTIRYTTPRRVYEPGATYDQDVRCFVGAGEDRRDAGGVTVFVSPEIRAQLAATKCGLDFDPSFDLTIPCDQSPDRIVGHVGFSSLEPDAQRETFDVFDARPTITLQLDGGPRQLTLETRTDDQGRYTWLLPELAPGLARFAETSARRQRVLEPWREEFPGDFERGDPLESSLGLITRYRGHLSSGTAALSRLLPQPMIAELGGQPLVLARHLSLRPEADCAKAKEGFRIVDAVTSVTAMVGPLLDDLLKLGLDCLSDFLAALWDFLNTFWKLAEKLLGFLASAGNTLAPWVLPLIRKPLSLILGIASRFFPETSLSLGLAMQQIERGAIPAGEALRALVEPAMRSVRETLQRAITNTAGTGRTLLQRISSSQTIGAIPGKAAEQARDGAIDALTGALLKWIATPESAATERATLEGLRDMLGLQPFAPIAHGAVGGTLANVGGFSYAGQPGTAATYVRTLPQLFANARAIDVQQYDWKRTWEAVVAAVEMLMLVAVVCAIAGAAAAPFTGGTSLVVTLGGVGMRVLGIELIAKVKAVVSLVVVLARAYVLIGAYAELVKAYEVTTLRLTGSVGL